MVQGGGDNHVFKQQGMSSISSKWLQQVLSCIIKVIIWLNIGTLFHSYSRSHNNLFQSIAEHVMRYHYPNVPHQRIENL